MQDNNLLNDFQYGFRKGCNTEEAVVNVVNYICKGLDEGHKGVVGIFYDFSKAFDLIDHNILLQKLKFYGILGRNLAFFGNYIAHRKQFVQINSHKSFIGSVECGVPQGSVLGPLLFVIYLNDIKNLCLHGKLFLYADDICLLYPYTHEEVVKAYVERDAALLVEFSRINKLVLNANKTKMVRFTPGNQQSNDFSIHVDGKGVTEVDSVKYLGIHLQKNLSWTIHIRNLKSKTSSAIGLLYKFKNKFNRATKFLIYNALIQSHYNYLAILYGWKKTTELKSLQRLQNKALKVVSNLPVMFSSYLLYTVEFKSTLPIHALYKLQILLFVFRCLHNIGHHTIHFRQNQHIFNTRNSRNLAIVRCRLELTKQRVEYMGTREYNNLPLALKSINRISIFKHHVKNYLFNNLEELLS